MSTATYHALQSSGFLHLPSERTLQDYTNYVRSRTGFQPEINEQLQNIESLPPSKHYVALRIDEMKVKEDLIYDKHTGQVIGFVSVSDVHGDLFNMELKCTRNSPYPPESFSN